jgi:hypothetical protein
MSLRVPIRFMAILVFFSLLIVRNIVLPMNTSHYGSILSRCFLTSSNSLVMDILRIVLVLSWNISNFVGFAFDVRSNYLGYCIFGPSISSPVQCFISIFCNIILLFHSFFDRNNNFPCLSSILRIMKTLI